MLGGWTKRFNSFLNENPKRKQLLGLLILLLAIPITVIAALRVQNLLQHAGGGGTLWIADAQGASISRTSDPNVYLMISLPPDWIVNPLTSAKESNISLAPKAFAQTSCPTITCGTNSGAGGVCSFGTSPDSNVSGCNATCPNGQQVPGYSISACQSKNCYYNDCTCYPNPGACDSSPTPTSAPTTLDCGPTSEGSWAYACDCTTQGGALGHHSTRLCSNGGVWTDPTCYEGLYLCKGGTSSVSTSKPIGFSCDPYPSCCGTIPLDMCSAKTGTTAPPTAAPFSCDPYPSCCGTIPLTSCSAKNQTTPPVHALKSLNITNNDTDGSSGGSDAFNITSGFNTYLGKPIPWRLNSLLPGQNEASRTVQVTLFDGVTFVPYVATVTLFRATQASGVLSKAEVSFNCNISQIVLRSTCNASALAYDSNNFPIFNGITYYWGISSVNSIGTLNKTDGNITSFYAQNLGTGNIWVSAIQGNQKVLKFTDVTVVQKVLGAKTINADINHDGKVDQKDIDILLSEFGRKGPNLPADLNHDGTVDGKDYNILIKQVKTP